MLKKPQTILQLKEVDISKIKYFIESLTDVEWEKWQHRQNTFNIHSQTKSYPLLCGENFLSEEFIVHKKNLNCEVWKFLNPIIDYLQYTYNGKCIKCMFVKLPSNCFIGEHQDTADALISSHRIHLPIVTNKNVKFFIDDKQYSLEEGFLYEINNQKHHSVENLSNYDRVHLIIDILPYDEKINIIYVDN